MFIKDLHTQYQSVKHNLEQLSNADKKDAPTYQNAAKTKNALNVLNTYIVTGDWTREESRKKFVAWIRSKYDYKFTAEQFNTSRESLDVFISRQDKRLNEIMGEALMLICQGRIDEGLCSFYAKSGTVSAHEFDYRISDLLPKPAKKDSIFLDECGQEIYLLQMLMRKEMQDWLSDADSERMAHLLYILGSSDPIDAKQKKELIKLLLKKDSFGENEPENG